MAIMATALLAFATGGCVDPLDDSLKPQPEEPTLTFWIKVPGSMFATKAETGDVASISPESKIYDVQVWAFAHAAETDTDAEDDLPLNYVDKDNISFENTTQKQWDDSYKIQMPIPKEFVLSESPKVDLYILANWQSIFATKPQEMTRAAVRDMVFGTSTLNTYFGTTTPTTSVPSKGLPISAIYKGEDGSGVSLQFLQDAYNGTATEPLTNAVFEREIGVIELERAVAKIRFAFARAKGIGGVQITKIVIDGDLIPDNTYAFPRANDVFALPGTNPTFGGATTLAGTGTNPLLSTDNIKEVTDPEALRNDNSEVAAKTGTGKSYAGKKPSEMTAQQYDDFVTDSTTTQLIYLRESDEPITGTIYYRKPGMDDDDDDLTAAFDMTKVPGYDVDPSTYDATTTNLHRNHYWTVYAYFRGGDLRIKPVLVQDWVYDQTKQYYDYKQQGEAHIVFSDKSQALFGYGYTTATTNTWYTDGKPTEWYFRRQDWNSADHEHDLVQPSGASPYAWNDWVHSQMVVAPGLNAANVPAYSNRIELVTSYFKVPLYLKLTNPADFSIVLYHTESNSYEVFSEASGAEIPSNYYLEGEETKHRAIRSYFYVVPKDTATPGATTGVYLVTGTDTDNPNPMKLPFNSDAFPGSQDYTEVYFYCVDEATFQDYYMTQPVNIKAYGKTGEVTI